MALAFRLPQPVTEEVVIALGRANPQHKIETTADGQIVMTPPTGTRSNFGELELARQVANWNAIHKLGRVTSASGAVTLPNGAIKSPDCAFVSHARWNAICADDANRAFVRVAPDAVFELLSPSDDFEEAVAKIREYLENGTGVALLLDPRDRTVRAYRWSTEAPLEYSDPDALALGEEMPGLRLDARAVFDACEGTD
jgi:Uma2 family endonuclease